MSKLIGIRIPYLKQISYISCDEDFQPNSEIVINSNNGYYLCEVASNLEKQNLMHNVMKKTKAVRLATPKDKRKNLKAFEELEIFNEIVKEAIKKLELPITLIGVWPSIDQSYMKIYYYSNSMIKFADIISYILKHYNKRVRIELVQVGRREYSAKIGGIGICGYELCCHSRHYSAPPITTETIRYIGYRITLKDQLIGSCSKYKCCLLYEAEEYRHYLKYLPNYGQKIQYEGKTYNIADINIFTKNLTLVNRYDRIELPFSYFNSKETEETDEGNS